MATTSPAGSAPKAAQMIYIYGQPFTPAQAHLIGALSATCTLAAGAMMILVPIGLGVAVGKFLI